MAFTITTKQSPSFEGADGLTQRYVFSISRESAHVSETVDWKVLLPSNQTVNNRAAFVNDFEQGILPSAALVFDTGVLTQDIYVTTIGNAIDQHSRVFDVNLVGQASYVEASINEDDDVSGEPSLNSPLLISGVETNTWLSLYDADTYRMQLVAGVQYNLTCSQLPGMATSWGHFDVIDEIGNKIVNYQNIGSDTVSKSFSVSTTGQYFAVFTGNYNHAGYKFTLTDPLVLYSANSMVLSGIATALYLTGTKDINGKGNALANLLTGNSGANTLDGLGGADTLKGGAGNDTYVIDSIGDIVEEAVDQGMDLIKVTIASVKNASNLYTLTANVENAILANTGIFSLTGNDLANALTGNAAANTLTGGIGDDTLDGKAGNDTLVGGAGNDIYYVDNLGDMTTENSDEGTDEVRSTITFDLSNKGANVENLTLLGAAAINATGNDLANTLTGNIAANILDGKAGADTMDGGKGNDTYLVDNAVDIASETLTVALGGGIDTVKSSVSHTLGSNIENLTLTGTDAINGTGNALANTILGNDGNNELDGLGGIDTLKGGKGNDKYIVDLIKVGTGATASAKLQDTVTENAGEGTSDELVLTTLIDVNGDQVAQDLGLQNATTITLGANFEWMTAEDTGTNKLNLTGNALDNRITGNAGNNILNGLAGADTLIGGNGNDTYVIDIATDVIDEQGGDLSDTLKIAYNNAATTALTISLIDQYAALENITLAGTGLFNLSGNDADNTLTGNASANRLDGGIGNDTLFGGAGNDILRGGAGNDVLEGGDGNDQLFAWGDDSPNGVSTDTNTLRGGNGDDYYIIDSYSDAVIETSATGGIDTVITDSLLTYTLPSFVENLIFDHDSPPPGAYDYTGIGNGLNNTISGNTGNDSLSGLLGNDKLSGLGGNDTLDGGAGIDTLIGGAGDDTYIVDNLGDKVFETTTAISTIDAGGTDKVQSSVSYTLGKYLENLTLTGSGNIIGTGNELANQLVGNGGNNILNGKAGDDILNGGGGTDTIIYTSSMVGYRFGINASGQFTITDTDPLAGGNDGSDTLIDIEQAKFADGTVMLRQYTEYTEYAETRVNTTTAGAQYTSAITALADGGYVVTWESSSQQDPGIYAQRYGASNAAVGGETRVNTTPASALETPAITALADGGYVVTWQSHSSVQDSLDIYAQRYDASGAAVGTESRINTTTSELQMKPAISAIADGGYVVTWNSLREDGTCGIYAQRYDPTGAAVGGETQINTLLDSDQKRSAITALADGGYVVTWISLQGDYGSSVYAQCYDAAGAVVGNETLVKTTDGRYQFHPDITTLTDGGYVVTWESYQRNIGEVDIYAQRYNASGVRVGNETRINTTTDNSQMAPSITALADGGYVVTWMSYQQGFIDDGFAIDIYAQRYDASSAAVGTETRINTATDGYPLPDITALADGDYVVTWGNGNIYAQRYDDLGNTATHLTGDANANIMTWTGAMSVTLDGGAGNDTLVGGVGADTLIGGKGNDTYLVDNAGDIVTESLTIALGGGIDTVKSYISYTLGSNSNVEKLTLMGTDSINGTGNELANTLTGNSGNNTLDGKAGADILFGGLGNDTYLVNLKSIGKDAAMTVALEDTITETAVLNSGIDTVQLSGTFNLTKATTLALGANLEKLDATGAISTKLNLTGNLAANTLTGNNEANILMGLGGDDQLLGGAGADTLIGGIGNDTLTGGADNDLFRFDSALKANIDTIADFTAGDKIQLENAVFTKLLKVGALSVDNFVSGAIAADSNDYILYDTTTGNLSYDADGSGKGLAVQFATLVGVPALTVTDFMVV